jgi:hypothetical protein
LVRKNIFEKAIHPTVHSATAYDTAEKSTSRQDETSHAQYYAEVKILSVMRGTAQGDVLHGKTPQEEYPCSVGS